MNIQDIMNSLGIEGPMTPEKAKAIKDAVQAILQSRQPMPPVPPGGGGGGGGGQIDLPIDPNLLQPSQKNKLQSTDDLEIEDPDDVLSKVKQNGPQMPQEDEQEEQGKKGQGGENEPGEKEDKNSSEDEEEEEESGTEEEPNTEEEEDDFDEEDFDDEQVLDDPNKNSESNKKRQNREITRSRAISLGRQTLDKAGDAPENKGKTEALEKAIEDLESLTEEDLDEMSDEVFSQKINKVIDSISALDPKTYVTDAETMAKRVQEIKKDFENPGLINELNQEDSQIVGTERRAVKASEREKAKYTSGSFKAIADFKINFYKVIKDQVEEIEQEDQSWSVINRRHDGTDRVIKGNRNEKLPNNLIPTIDIYIDCSGSWEDGDIKIGEDIVGYVLEFEQKKQIKTNLYYFSYHVHSTKAAARAEGGTNAWDLILENIKTNKTKNVVILTDSDMGWDATRGAKCLIEGCVWLIWRDGINSQEIPKHLVGKRGNYQYEFKSARSIRRGI